MAGGSRLRSQQLVTLGVRMAIGAACVPALVAIPVAFASPIAALIIQGVTPLIYLGTLNRAATRAQSVREETAPNWASYTRRFV